MSWCGIHGHDQIVESFRNSLRQNRLASTFLFVGPSGIGKRMFALKLAQALQCERHSETQFEPCQVCPPCQQVLAGSHPDVEYVQKPVDRAFIPVSTFIGDKDHRMQEGICHWIGLKPAYGKRKIAIIDDADYLNQEGANCLLKTLEEPPPRCVLILIGTSQHRQLPTIRSRCQIVRFHELDEGFIADRLVATGVARDADQAKKLARLSRGSFELAAKWANDDLAQFRTEIWRSLSTPDINTTLLAKRISEFVDSAGKEASVRREQLRIVIEVVIHFLRQMLLFETGSMSSVDPEIEPFVRDAANSWSIGPETISSRIDRCVDADRQVAANANLATLVECWIDDLFHDPVFDCYS